MLSRYHMILQQQKQRATLLKTEINEKEIHLASVKVDLDTYNEQLRKNAQELLQVCRQNHLNDIYNSMSSFSLYKRIIQYILRSF